MNKKLVVILLFLALALCQTSYAKPQFSACGHHDYPPWNWVENGQIVGVCAEVSKVLFKQIGVELDLSYRGPWKRCLNDIELGKVDVNICSFINAHRAAYSTFSKNPMGVNEQALFVATGSEVTFNQLDDLKDNVLGLVLGVSLGQEFDQFVVANNIKIVRLSSYKQAFKMLILGRIDAVPVARSTGLSIIAELGLSHKIKDLPTPILKGKLHISIANTSELIKKSPQLERLMAKPEYKNWVEQLKLKYTKQYQQRKNP